MKTFSSGLQTHLAGNLTTLATCILVTRTDLAAYGFTAHDRPLVIGGITYAPAASFNPTDLAANLDMDIDNLTVEGVLSSDTITEDDLRAGRWDYAAYRIFQVNWSDLTQGDKKDSAGHLGEVSVNVQTFVSELLGLMEAYITSIGSITQPGCRNNLGDRKCKVDLAPFTFTGTVDSADADFFTLHDSALTQADGYFDQGVITFTSDNGAGKGNGLAYEVKTYTVGVLVTMLPMAYLMAGADYSITRGCDRTFTTCNVVFGNVINFNGEPWLRGVDAMLQVGRHNG